MLKSSRTILDICPSVEAIIASVSLEDGQVTTTPESQNDILWGMFKEKCDDLLKFVRIGKDYQEYRLPIPETMLTDVIKQSESYQMLIKYSTGQIPPKKSRGKGSKGKKTVDNSQETVDVSEESEPEPEPAKKKNSSEKIVSESVPETAKKKSGSRSSKSVVIQDTPSAPKSKPATSKTKLKGAHLYSKRQEECKHYAKLFKMIKMVMLMIGDDHISDTQDADDEDVKTESDEDDIYNKARCWKRLSEVKDDAKEDQTPFITLLISVYLSSFLNNQETSTTVDLEQGSRIVLSEILQLNEPAPEKEPVKEPIVEMVMDDAGDDVARDDNQPQDTSEPKTRKTPNLDWFKQPLMPPTPDSK
ncbi:hypothetical protein Tco_0178822 [Tanacetum coccineum]